MSYGNLETLRRFRKSESYKKIVESVLELDEETLNKMETLFPFPQSDYSKVNDNYDNEYMAIILGTANRFNGSDCELFKFGEYPTRREFYGVLEVTTEDGSKPFVVSYKEFISYLLGNKHDEFEIKAINPNLNRLGKMLYGSSIRSVIPEIGGWFVGHLTDNHTNLFKKNIGNDYKVDRLSEAEQEASGGWLDLPFQQEVKSAFNLYYESKYISDMRYAKTEQVIDLVKMMGLVDIIEEDKSGITGYGYTDESGLDVPKLSESPLTYLINNYGNGETLRLFRELLKKSAVEDIMYTILTVARDNCLTNDISCLLEGALAEVYYSVPENFDKDEVPYYELAGVIIQRGITLRKVMEEYEKAKSGYTIKEIDRESIWDYRSKYLKNNKMFITPKDIDATGYIVYDGRDKSITPYGKALCTKYKLDMDKVLDCKEKFASLNCSEALKGEAACIVVAQSLNYKIPNHQKLPRDYAAYFQRDPKPIQEFLKAK